MGAVGIKQVSLAAMLITLGVVIAPYLWFFVGTSKANPSQHMINALAGVLLGPLWAAFIAFCIGLIRMNFGVGTIFSMPGGIPGGLMVGLFYWFLRKTGRKHPELAALTEPIGTIFIGVPLAVYLIGPLFGKELTLIIALIGWSFSCIPGCIFGFVILEALRAAGFTREIFEG